MFEEVTIKQFSDAWFFEKYETLSKTDFEICYNEYIDAAGLFTTAEFDLVCYIHYLHNRINSIDLSISLQKQFMLEFDVPYEPAFSFFKKFGYKVTWNNDQTDFFNQLDKVKRKEAKYEVELKIKTKELFDERKKKNDGETPDIKQSRTEFIKMINTLGKIGYKIDKNETTVEELALMLKQQFDESEALKLNQYAGR